MKQSNSTNGLTSLAVLQWCVLTAVAVLSVVPIYAVTYDATGATTEQTVQMRVGADFTKKWKSGVRLSIGEELRFNLMDNVTGTTSKQLSADANNGASFAKSYTNLVLAYTHPQFMYLKMDAGYTLRLLGNKGWSDPNEFLRHRVFLGLTGSYSTQHVKLSLRERFVCDMRTDSVNLFEKNQYDWHLRSRLGAEFVISGKPVKPYVWAELENTLNAPDYQQKDGHQFISRVRTQAGVKWRLSKLSSLDFYYRFQYGYDRDINITRNKGFIQLTEETTYLHAIGISYNFNW